MVAHRVVLGLDPATHTGWCVLAQRDSTITTHAHGVHNMTVGRHDSQGMAYLRLERWLREIIALVKPTQVAFEEVPAHKGVHAAHRYGGIVAHIMRVCDELGVPYCGVPIATWKRMATGKGNAGKPAIRAQFEKDWPAQKDWSQDEIDAYYITLAVMRDYV